MRVLHRRKRELSEDAMDRGVLVGLDGLDEDTDSQPVFGFMRGTGGCDRDRETPAGGVQDYTDWFYEGEGADYEH